VVDSVTQSNILTRLAHALAGPARIRLPFRVDADIVGWVNNDRADRLEGFSEFFAVDGDGVSFLPALHDENSRSEAMAIVTATLATEGALTQWRNELYAAAPSFGGPPWFMLERAAARYFGVHTWAVHINGVVRGPTESQMWFARRSVDKAIDPNQLDNLVGGGIAAGTTIIATLAKEAWEESGIPAELAAQSLLGGTVHLWREQPDGLQSETIFVHDLWLPEDFVPANQDGEANDHRRVTLTEAARLIAVTDGSDVVTADASLVVLDFLLRHGEIDSVSPAYTGLKQLLCAQAAARRA
jgi:8-oxo-dGTP pyrophosphatase MutT (NUDIX family)